MSGIFQDIIDSIFSPTTRPQRGVVKAMNVSFYGLFVSLFGLAFITSWNPHVLALSAVAVLLFISITWFVAELGKIEDQQKLEQAKATPTVLSEDATSQPTSTSTALPPVESASLVDRKTAAKLA